MGYSLIEQVVRWVVCLPHDSGTAHSVLLVPVYCLPPRAAQDS